MFLLYVILSSFCREVFLYNNNKLKFNNLIFFFGIVLYLLFPVRGKSILIFFMLFFWILFYILEYLKNQTGTPHQGKSIKFFFQFVKIKGIILLLIFTLFFALFFKAQYSVFPENYFRKLFHTKQNNDGTIEKKERFTGGSENIIKIFKNIIANQKQNYKIESNKSVRKIFSQTESKLYLLVSIISISLLLFIFIAFLKAKFVNKKRFLFFSFLFALLIFVGVFYIGNNLFEKLKIKFDSVNSGISFSEKPNTKARPEMKLIPLELTGFSDSNEMHTVSYKPYLILLITIDILIGIAAVFLIVFIIYKISSWKRKKLKEGLPIDEFYLENQGKILWDKLEYYFENEWNKGILILYELFRKINLSKKMSLTVLESYRYIISQYDLTEREKRILKKFIDSVIKIRYAFGGITKGEALEILRNIRTSLLFLLEDTEDRLEDKENLLL